VIVLAQLLAVAFLFALLFANALANAWLTFGLWPRNWWAFACFAFACPLTIHYLLTAITKSITRTK
jgi:hypothetical protein